MKRVLLLVVAVMSISPFAFAGDKNKKAANAAANNNEVRWMNWEDVQVAMKKQPKKVWVDVYTDWCGWCKVMDKKTFSDPQVVKYMNDNFYAVKFNSEKEDSIRFMGKLYIIKPDYKANELAIQLMRGEMKYPTGIFLEENFQNPIPIPGYHGVQEMELFLKYLNENHYKTTKFEDYQKAFVPTWKESVATN
jgi:thioredoxin-related protein